MELVQKLSEEREHYQREDEQRKIEYKQMVLKTQTPLCMVMDITKNTNKENSKLQADIKATRDSVNKLKAQARKADKNITRTLLKQKRKLKNGTCTTNQVYVNKEQKLNDGDQR